MLNEMKKKVTSNVEVIFLTVILLVQTGFYINLNMRVSEIERMLKSASSNEELAIAKAPDIKLDGEAVRGNKDALITIVEFGDYECPYCASLNPVIEDILKEYEGKVRFVFKDYPLTSIHLRAMESAQAVHCAGEQNKYWEMHDLLFAKQNDLTHNKLIQYGSELGLNVEQYKSCVDAKKYESDIQRDVIEGDSYKIRGTPILYINGERIDDASIDGLRYHIDNLLK